jgi:hypothetical protein
MTDMTGAAGTGRRPSRAAVGVVELALRVLPQGDVRHRYERELVAELYGLDRGRQARYVLGVLVSVWSLRAAVTAEQYTLREEAMGHVIHRRPLLCRVNLYHRWRTGNTEDGSIYQYCDRCGKLRPDRPKAPMMG